MGMSSNEPPATPEAPQAPRVAMRPKKTADSNGHSGTIHINGGTQRDAHGIEVFVKVEFLAQRHVDGDVGRRRAREECVQTALLQASEQERIRILTQHHKRNERIENQSIDQHATHQEQQQVTISREDFEAAFRYCCEYQSLTS